jgi:hypothetical protein
LLFGEIYHYNIIGETLISCFNLLPFHLEISENHLSSVIIPSETTVVSAGFSKPAASAIAVALTGPVNT